MIVDKIIIMTKLTLFMACGVFAVYKILDLLITGGDE